MLGATHQRGDKDASVSLSYRADIDGLRAIAVSLVVLYHFGIAPFHGGFVGVDVFFVISGFLITRILDADFASGNYSVTDFYARRIRRIFPALLFMIVSMCGIYFALEFPDDVADLARSATSAVLFYSNFRFFFSTNYFDAKTALDPLLHTWSLGVEEQFYIFFPLVLYALRRHGKQLRIAVLGALFTASLLASAWMVHFDQSAAFYLLPFRAWELMTGALLAEGFVPTLKSWMLRSIEAAVGLALILASSLILTAASHFPGLAALTPCVGAASLIHAGLGGQTPINRLLSIKPIRLIGLLSYSIYLWHWPLYVLYVNHIHRPSSIESIFLALGCVAVSGVSYRFIERPFRRQQTSNGNRAVLLTGGISMALTCFVATGVSLASAELNPVMSNVKTVLAYSNYDPYASMRIGKCFLTSRNNDFSLYDQKECLRIEPGKVNVLLLGDSHAAELLPGFKAAYPDTNFLQATASGCKPFVHPSGEDRCTKVMNLAFHDFIPMHRVDAIVLSAIWFRDDITAAKEAAAFLSQYTDNVIVVGPTPQFDQPLPVLLARGIKEKNVDLAYQHALADPAMVDREFASSNFGPKITYISAYDALCTPKCHLWVGRRVPLFFDSNHLTSAASEYLVETIGNEIRPAMKGTEIHR